MLWSSPVEVEEIFFNRLHRRFALKNISLIYSPPSFRGSVRRYVSALSSCERADMIVACVLITHFRAKIELGARPELADRAFVVADRTRAGSPVVDRSPAARGVLPGATLRLATSIHPDLVVLDADESRYRVAFDRLLDSLGRVSDAVEDGGLGEAYVGLDGLGRLYGGDAGIAAALLNAVPDRLNPRVGVADSKFAAYAAARSSKPMRATKAPDDARLFLASMSMDILPVSGELKSELRRFGMRLLEDVAAMSAAAMFDRFGREGLFAWELSGGMDRRPLTPRGVDEFVAEHTTLPFSTTSLETLWVGLGILLRRAFSRPALRNRSAGATTLASSTSDGEPWRLRTRFSNSGEALGTRHLGASQRASWPRAASSSCKRPVADAL